MTSRNSTLARSRIVRSLCLLGSLVMLSNAATPRHRGGRRKLGILDGSLAWQHGAPPDLFADESDEHSPLVPASPQTPRAPGPGPGPSPSPGPGLSPKLGPGSSPSAGPSSKGPGSSPSLGPSSKGSPSSPGPSSKGSGSSPSPGSSSKGPGSSPSPGPSSKGSKSSKGYSPTGGFAGFDDCSPSAPGASPGPAPASKGKSSKFGCKEGPPGTPSGSQPLTPTVGTPTVSKPTVMSQPSMSSPGGASPSASSPGGTAPSASSPSPGGTAPSASSPSMSDPASSPAAAPSFSGAQPDTTSGDTGFVFVDCNAIADGSATTDGDETVFNLNMPFFLESDASFGTVAEDVRTVLQSVVAPRIAGCTDDGLLSGRRRLEDSTILNVLFSTPSIDGGDGLGLCSSNSIEDTDCYPTNTGVNFFADGEENDGYLALLTAEMQRAIDEGLLGDIDGLAGVGGITGEDVTPPPDDGIAGASDSGFVATDSGLSTGGKVGIAMGALALVLLLVLLVRRRRNRQDRAVKYFDYDDENILLDGTLDTSVGGARVLDGEDDSFLNESVDSSVIRNIRTLEGLEDAQRADNSLIGRHHAGQNVHVCQSSMCDICEKRRELETVFVRTGTPTRPSLPENASRPYVASDTVAL